MTIVDSPVVVAQVVRRLRGKNNPELVVGQDGCFYVAKFGRRQYRSWINECIANAVLNALHIPTPQIRFLLYSQSFEMSLLTAEEPYVGETNQTYFRFASRCPVEPSAYAIYDFLPKALNSKIQNRTDFVKVLAFDRAFGHTGLRQAIYTRARKCCQERDFIAYFLGHSQVLAGQSWVIPNSISGNLYFNRSIYQVIDREEYRKACISLKRLLENTTFSRMVPPLEGILPEELQRLDELQSKVLKRIQRIEDLGIIRE